MSKKFAYLMVTPFFRASSLNGHLRVLCVFTRTLGCVVLLFPPFTPTSMLEYNPSALGHNRGQEMIASYAFVSTIPENPWSQST